MRALRRVVIALAVLGGLFVGADKIVEGIAEKRIADAAQRELGTRERPEVGVSGFPVIVHVLRGELGGVFLRATGVQVEDLLVRSVDVRLTGITGLELSAAGPFDVRVARGTAVAEVDERALNDFLASKDVHATLSLREGSATVRTTRTVFGRARRIAASGRVTLRRSVLTFIPQRVTVDGRAARGLLLVEAAKAATVRVEIPDLPGGVRADAFEIHAGFVRLRGSVRDEEISLRETR